MAQIESENSILRGYNMKNYSLFYLLFFILSGCMGNGYGGYTVPEKLNWEKSAKCQNNSFSYKQGDEKKLFTCSITYKKGMPKLYPSWQEGKTYMGVSTLDRKFSFDPIYEHIWIERYSRNHTFLFKKYGDKNYSIYNLKTNVTTQTPIEYLEAGKVFNGSPITENVPAHLRYYSGAFSDSMKTYYILSSNLDIIKKVENVDNDPKRKALFPPVHTLTSTHTILANNSTRMVRHKMGDKIFYQVYSADGNKVGSSIPFEKVHYFYQKTHYGSGKFPYDVRPWIHKGDDVYMPIVHYGKDQLFDATKDHGDFLGVIVKPDPNKVHSGVFAGYQYAPGKTVPLHRSTTFLFQDKKGNYKSTNWYDFHAHPGDPLKVIAELKKDPTNFHREMIALPLFTGATDSKGQLVETKVTLFQGLNEDYYFHKKEWKQHSLSSYEKNNSFSSIEKAQNVLIQKQNKMIANEKARQERMAKEEAYKKESERIRKKVAANMASNWAERDQREKEHADKMAILDHNEKHKKPNPLLNLDLKKIFDTAGAERRAACYKKMSDSKKAYLRGRQKWYYQGKCK